MFSNVYDPTDMQKAVKERRSAYKQVYVAMYAARWPEYRKQMTWASRALRTLICKKMWHRFVT